MSGYPIRESRGPKRHSFLTLESALAHLGRGDSFAYCFNVPGGIGQVAIYKNTQMISPTKPVQGWSAVCPQGGDLAEIQLRPDLPERQALIVVQSTVEPYEVRHDDRGLKVGNIAVTGQAIPRLAFELSESFAPRSSWMPRIHVVSTWKGVDYPTPQA